MNPLVLPVMAANCMMLPFLTMTIITYQWVAIANDLARTATVDLRACCMPLCTSA